LADLFIVSVVHKDKVLKHAGLIESHLVLKEKEKNI